jgi:uncharacterized membrane protein
MRAQRSAFERVYSVIVAIKGLDGVLELVAGLVLLLAPDVAAGAFTALADELAEGSSVLQQALAMSADAASGGVAAGALPLAVFLVIHGVVKLLTVTALLRRAVRWYPWAIGALVVLLVAQVVDVVASPGIGGVVLAVLDVAVLVLVVWEYRRLRREPAPALEPDRAAVR